MPELLDVIDKNDNVIGQEERNICLQEKLLHRGVHIFVFNSAGELLLQKRSISRKTYPGRWTTSCSGHVSSGQTYEEAAIREMEEELGVFVNRLEEVTKFTDPNPVDTEICKIFKILHEGPFDFGRDEVSEVKFLPVEKIKEELKNSLNKYTPDFALAFREFLKSEKKNLPMEEIILVDKNDKPVGFMEKIKAHENHGTLHRAFSIFVFNSEGQLLLQLRSVNKHHFGGLWTNTVCSHPRKGEELGEAVHRRLMEEFGFDTELNEIFSFVYQVDDPKSGLAEHEFDHVFIGKFNGRPKPNPEEIDDYKWMEPKEVLEDMEKNPQNYTLWSKIALKKILESEK